MYRKNVKLLSIFNFLIGFSLFAPLAIIYFSKISGSYTLGASIFGLTMLSSAIFEVPTGLWSDRVGRRKTIILGSWARVLAFILYAIGHSYWWLVVGAILEGLSSAFYSGNNDAFLHDTLTDDGLESEYDEHLGKTSSHEQLALGISAIVGGIIANFSFTYLMWLSVFSQIPLLFISHQFIEPKTRTKINTNIYVHIKEALKLFVTNYKLRLLSLGSMLSFAIGENKYQFRAAFVNTIWPLWAIGLGNVLSNFGASASYFFSHRLIKKFKAVNILFLKSIYGKFVGLIAYGFPTIISPFLLSTPSLLHGVGRVSESKLMQHEFTEHQRATMSSLNSFGGSLLFFCMSLLLGGMADHWSPAVALVIMTLLEMPVIYFYWLLFKNDRKVTV